MFISREIQIIRVGNLPQANLGGEALALLHADAGFYFGLHGVGARVWEMLAVPRTVQEICAALESDYDISSEECESQTLDFVSQLAKEGLIVEASPEVS